MPIKTREAWLLKAADELKKGLFQKAEIAVPKVRVTVGFAYGSRSPKGPKHIGQCFHPKASAKGYHEILICPTRDSGAEVLAILAHELIHATLHSLKSMQGVKAHGPEFRARALAIGLKGPMRATTAGVEFKEEAKRLLQKLGKFPHARLNVEESGRKKQTVRMIKMECLECHYIARASRKFIVAVGPVVCPVKGHGQMDVDEKFLDEFSED